MVVEVENSGRDASQEGHRHGEVVFEDFEEELLVDAEGDQVFDDFGSEPAAFVGHGVDGADRVARAQLKVLIRTGGAAVDDASEGEQEVRASIADVPEDFAFGKVDLLNVTSEISDRVDLTVAE